MAKSVSEGDSVTVQRRKKRVSKKNKIAWRKHTNTKDVDAFLDDFRLEERVGVHLNTAEDDKIFYFDKTLSVPVEKCPSRVDRKLEAKKKLEGAPKCFESLVNHCSVPDPIKRNRVRTLEERKHPILKRIEANRRTNGILKAKEKMAIKNRKIHEKQKSNAPKMGQYNKDLWKEDEGKPPNVGWINSITARHILHTNKELQKKAPATLTKKTSVLPAIEAPHPGMSYNPSYADHCALLQDIAEQEKKKIKEDEHLTRVTTNMFSNVTEKDRDETFLEEMLQGTPHSNEIKIKEEDVENSEYKAINSPAKDKKKTHKQRRNIRLAKDEEHQRKLKAIEKKKVADIYKLKKIVQNIDKTDVKARENQTVRKNKKEMKKLEAKRLSIVKYEAPEPEFNMPFELSGNLRGMKTEGNILTDRFKSLQRRNILQPTLIRMHKQSKKKVYTKNTHK